jgi:putative DNA primase/helicase
MYEEGVSSESTDMQRAIADHAKRSERRHELESMIALARSLQGVPVRPHELDANPWLLNCQNGTLDLCTGALGPHQQADLMTKVTPINFSATAQCPAWLAFLSKVLDGDSALIDFVQKMLGYTLTGIVSEKALFVLHGSGDNGKTTLLEVVRYILGDYAGSIDIEVLMSESDNSARERAIADMLGKRFVTSSEADDGRKFHEAKIKYLTGMGRVTGRRIYGSSFEYDPNFKLFIDANHKPVVRGSDDAIWNRIRLIPFDVAIPKSQQDKGLRQKLLAEADGILRWSVKGCLKWKKEGLENPVAVEHASGQYRDEMDIVARFLDECCERDSGQRAVFSDLFAAFRDWCRQCGESPISETAFGKRLSKKGFEKDRNAQTRFWAGLRLIERVAQREAA